MIYYFYVCFAFNVPSGPIEDELEALIKHYIEKDKSSSSEGAHTSCMCSHLK